MFDNFEQIEVSVENRVATVTLNRPDRSNALGTKIVEELERSLGDRGRRRRESAHIDRRR